MTEQQKNQNETPKPTGYNEQLQTLMGQAESEIEKAGALAIVLEQAMGDAEQGLLSSSRDNEPYSRSDLLAQLKRAVEETGKGDFVSGVNSIPRAGSLRDALRAELTSVKGLERFKEVVKNLEQLDQYEKREIIEDIADEAIEAATGVVDPEVNEPADFLEISVEAAARTEDVGKYDYLLRKDNEGGSVKDARVPPSQKELDERATQQRQQKDLETARGKANENGENWRSIK
jgi:hypothetical protein